MRVSTAKVGDIRRRWHDDLSCGWFTTAVRWTATPKSMFPDSANAARCTMIVPWISGCCSFVTPFRCSPKF